MRGKNKPNGWFPENHVKLMSKSKGETKTTTAVPVAPVHEQHGQEDFYSVPVRRKGLFIYIIKL